MYFRATPPSGDCKQQLLVELDRRGNRFVETRLATLVFGDRLVVVAERDACACREPLDGVDEVEVLDLTDERDRVAVGLATEAVPREDVVLERERVLLRDDRAEDLLDAIGRFN